MGANAFRADVALVVTWHLTISDNIQNIDPSDLSKASTYQMVWVTDADATVSYVIFNYHRLGFASADLNGNNKLGRCSVAPPTIHPSLHLSSLFQALFNGGNHTGQVPVLPGPEVKDNPITLAQLSAVPPKYRGRYLFRVDDVVLRGGCSNKTEVRRLPMMMGTEVSMMVVQGTVPIMVTPDVVSMVGKTTVDVNGMCWIDRTKTYSLFIEGQKSGGPCIRMNAAISRCPLPPLQVPTLIITECRWRVERVAGLGDEERLPPAHAQSGAGQQSLRRLPLRRPAGFASLTLLFGNHTMGVMQGKTRCGSRSGPSPSGT